MKKSLLICILAVMLCVSMLFAACAPSLEAATLESMKEILYQMYKGSNPTNTYKVTGMVASNGERANVQWSVNVTAGDENAVKVGEYDEESKQVTIEVDPEPATDVAYTLTATLVNEKGVAYKIDGEPVSVSFERSLTAFVINTYEEYLAACEADDGTIIRVRGYVTGVNADSGSSSKGSLWIRDAEGHGYYAYKPALDSSITASRESINAAFPVGAEVIISGPVNSTYGPQHKEGCEITKTGNTAPAGWNTPVDQTEAFGSADDMLDAESLQQYYGSIVTIKGVTLGQHENGTYNYYFTVNGVEYIFYMNIYLMDTEASNATAAKWVVGGKANLTGLVTTYSKKFQLYPYSPDCLEIIQEDLTDAQKVERAQANLTIADTAAEGDEITLPATGAEGTTITWALAEGKTYDFATLADGKLTITATPSSTTKIQLVATITCGSESATKALEVTVAGATFELINFAQAVELCGTTKDQYTEDKYYMMGTIKEVTNTTYGNMTIVDENGTEFTLYGTYDATGANRYDAMENAPVAGDVIVVYGKLGYYNAPQMKNGWIIASYDVKTFAQAVELCGTTKDQYTEDKYYMMGTIKEVTNTTYGNMTIVDENGTEFTLYGTYDATGANRYDAMAKAPVAGDVIVVYGKLGYYNAPQMKNGWIVVVGPAGVAQETPAHTCESKCVVCGGCEDAACTEEACTTKCNCVAQDAPEAGTYNLKLVHTNLENKVLYFTGAMDGHYFATSENEADAVVITLVKLENGKYTMQLANGKYLAIVPSGTYINVVMQDTAAEWTWNAKLGNFTIDVNGTAYFYGTSSTGTYTTISQRKLSDASTTCQANLVALSGGSTGGETPAPHTCESVCPTCQGCLDADCTETACATKCEGHTAPEGITTVAGALAGKEGDKATFTGTVSGIYQNWDSYYGNMSVYVSDDQGNRIIVFRTTTQLGVGDVVTVSGTVTIYQTTGVAQIAQGSTVTIDVKHECSEFTPATCLSAAVCTVCGKVDGEPLEHTDAADSNGKCDLCGEDMQSAAAQVTVTASYPAGTTTNMSANNNAATIGLDATIFNVTSQAFNGTSNRVGLNKAGNMRLYKNGNCNMTISVASGYQIVSIKVTFASSTTSQGVLVVTVGSSAVSAQNGVYMINGSSVVLSNSGSDQVHIQTIEIVYAPVAQ